MGLAQSRQQPAQSVPARFADNIADKKKVHRTEFNPERGCGKPAFGRQRPTQRNFMKTDFNRKTPDKPAKAGTTNVRSPGLSRF